MFRVECCARVPNNSIPGIWAAKDKYTLGEVFAILYLDVHGVARKVCYEYYY